MQTPAGTALNGGGRFLLFLNSPFQPKKTSRPICPDARFPSNDRRTTRQRSRFLEFLNSAFPKTSTIRQGRGGVPVPSPRTSAERVNARKAPFRKERFPYFARRSSRIATRRNITSVEVTLVGIPAFLNSAFLPPKTIVRSVRHPCRSQAPPDRVRLRRASFTKPRIATRKIFDARIPSSTQGFQ